MHGLSRGTLCLATMLIGLGACKTELSPDSLPSPNSTRQSVATDEGSWSATGRMANGRLLYTATRLPDGRVLAAGGYNRSAELYDPATGTWGRTNDTPNTYRSATATLLTNGRVLLAGAGGAEWDSGFSAALYDQDTGTWALTGNMRTPRLSHSATLLADGRVLVTGGADREYGGSVLASAEVYDPATGTWAPSGAMTRARRNHTATLLRDGRVLVTGGTDAGGTLQSSAEVYNPATGTWSPAGNLTTARGYHSATLLEDGRVLIAGGGGADKASSASAELFDPASGTFAAAASMAQPRRYHSATSLLNGKVLVAGGFHEFTGIQTAAEVYDPADGTWHSAGRMAADRYQHTATLLANGAVLVAGGFSNANQASADLYTSTFAPEPGPPVGEPVEPEGTSMLIQVVSHEGAPIPGATVMVAGSEQTADPQGNALFQGIAAGSMVAQVRAPGFAAGTVAVDLEEGAHGSAVATLRALTPPVAFNANADATVVAGQVQVELPAGSLVDENGQPVTGTAEISFAPIDPSTDAIASSPGPLEAIAAEGAEPVSLESGYMAEIALTQNGRPLQLAPGATASITFPLSANFAASPGELIPAWWFDAEDGVWREDGVGVVEESPTEPGRLIWRAEVSHFTPYNLDRPFRPQTCVNVLVTDHNGSPLPGRVVTMRGWNFNYWQYAVTRSDGRICMSAMSGQTYQVSVGSLLTGVASTFVFPSGSAVCGRSGCTQVTLRVPAPCGASGTVQACAYTGPVGTNGVGACRAGYRVCNGVSWGACTGQVTPRPEVCNNTEDENCNGRLNDGCPVCTNGSTQSCYTGPTGTNGVGLCRAGTRTCINGAWGACTGQVVPRAESCTTAGDDDCDGLANEGCVCTPGQTQTCAYTGPAGTQGVGQCRAGVRTCSVTGSTPFWSACAGEVRPATETCDGRDNSCNGQVDEGNPGGGGSCSTGRPGICAPGTLTCSGGALSCRANASPTAEICDGLDNDCDGLTDEGNPGGNASCSTGQPGVCALGTTTCSGGALVCRPNASPSTEICDGRDNDCDGQTDEGNPGSGAACSTGQPGVCAQGTTTCSGGALVCRANASPSTEICDGLDNNCNGQSDEGNPGGGAACSTGQPGVCAQGTVTCSGGALACRANTAPSTEVCDGRDNNCNGQSDEGNPGGGAACSTGQPGVCAQGTTICSGGSLACQANTAPSTEICDGRDNNCNGQTDEGNPGGGAACSTGQPGVCSRGTTICSGGGLVCRASASPTAETCDGLDNDCDGLTDEGNPGGGAACSTGQPGVCAQGTTLCSGGGLVCNRNTSPSSEVCGDNLDNDCDGQTDEDCSGAGDCPGNLLAYRGQNGRQISCTCSAAMTTSGTVWGTDFYTDDSSLCRAGVHAGRITTSGGRITAVIYPGLSQYIESTRNGVTSFPWDAWDGSYYFQ